MKYENIYYMHMYLYFCSIFKPVNASTSLYVDSSFLRNYFKRKMCARASPKTTEKTQSKISTMASPKQVSILNLKDVRCMGRKRGNRVQPNKKGSRGEREYDNLRWNFASPNILIKSEQWAE